jgi:hypothetical protein
MQRPKSLRLGLESETIYWRIACLGLVKVAKVRKAARSAGEKELCVKYSPISSSLRDVASNVSMVGMLGKWDVYSRALRLESTSPFAR